MFTMMHKYRSESYDRVKIYQNRSICKVLKQSKVPYLILFFGCRADPRAMIVVICVSLVDYGSTARKRSIRISVYMNVVYELRRQVGILYIVYIFVTLATLVYCACMNRYFLIQICVHEPLENGFTFKSTCILKRTVIYVSRG